MSNLTDHQKKLLFSPVNPKRVGQVRGMAHMEAWDIRRQLIRTFGFGGYTVETISLDLVAERETKQGDKSRWTVVYRAQVRLTVKDTSGNEIGHWEDGAAGDSVNQPSLGDAHDMAMKTALSQALKRCAVNLGDQFGLSLYNNGSPEAVVMWSAAHPPTAAPGQPEVVPDRPEDPPVHPEPQPVATQPDPVVEPDPGAAQNIANLAASAGSPDRLRQLWATSKTGRLLERQVNAPDTGEAVQLGAYLTRRAAEIKQAPAAPAAEVDGDRAAAIADLRAAAAAVDMADVVDAEFEASYRTALDRAPIAQIRDMTSLLRGSAA